MQLTDKPSYMWVQEEVRRRITSGVWRHGDRIPTERELEKEFSLSRMTVSKGLGNLVAEGLLIRKKGQGTFVTLVDVPNTRHLIKFIAPNPICKSPFRFGALEAMHEELVPNGYNVGVDFYTDGSDLADCLRRNCDSFHAGFVVFYRPGDGVGDRLADASEFGLPLVLIDAYPDDYRGDMVVANNAHGGRLMIDHLYSLGHRDIAYISWPVDRSSLRDRAAGFIQQMLVHGLAVTSKTVQALTDGTFAAFPELRELVANLLSEPHRPTALCFSNDVLALEAMEYINSLGLTVPEDISVVGYDNVDWCTDSLIPLTTVNQDMARIAKEASLILLERIGGKSSPRPIRVFIEPELVVRASTCRVKQGR